MAWPTSARWRSTIAAPVQQAVVLVNVLEPSGALARVLPVVSGNVDVDANRAVRRQVALEIAREAISPHELLDLLDPRARRELRIWRGLDYGKGQAEMVPLGTFTPVKPSATSDIRAPLRIIGLDRSRRLARASWTNRYYIASGTNVSTAIAGIVANRAPWLKVDCAPTTVTTPSMWLGLDPEGSNPWADIQTLAQSAAQEAFVDPMGTLITRAVPDPATTPTAAEFIAGPNCTLTDAEMSLDDEQTYNGVILVGEGTDIPVPLRSEVWDTDPGSKTNRSIYGDVPYFATTNIAPSQAALDAAAAAMLRKMLGLTQQASLEAVPNPSLDAGDVVRVNDIGTSLFGLFIVDTLTIPLNASDSMSLGLRERRI